MVHFLCNVFNDCMTEGTITAQEKFRNEYYLKLEVIYWLKKIDACHERYTNTEDIVEKSECVIDIYSIYLQIIEILFININAAGASPATFLPNLFIRNDQLREFIQSAKKSNSNVQEGFLSKRIKPIINFLIKDAEKADKTYRAYKTLFKELISDYLKDYEMLNAYKHGFRVDFKSQKSEYSLTKDKQHYSLGVTNAQIKYYSKNKGKTGDPLIEPELIGKDIVYDHLVSFNAERIFGKAKFVYTLLENVVARGKQLAQPDKNVYYRCMEIDLGSKEWKDTSSSFRHKMQFAYFTDTEPTQS